MSSTAEMVRKVHRCKIKRLGRSSNEQIFTLQNIIEQPLEHCGPLIITYVDFKKVLHSIYGRAIWNILKMNSISQGYIDIFQELYANSQHYVRTGSGTTLYFKQESSKVTFLHLLSSF